LYERLKAAIEEMHDIARGDALPARVWELTPDGKGGFTRRQVDPTEFGSSLRKKLQTLDPANEAVAARVKLGLSQQHFARLLGVSPGTLQGWEQGRRKPNGAARVLLQVAVSHPDAVLRAAHALAS
jgi:putative transcriptional regulator